MRPSLFLLAAAGLAATAFLIAPTGASGADRPETGGDAAPPRQTTYDVAHTLTVEGLPEGAHRVRMWFWMPEDRPGQRVLDFRVTEGPDGVRITRDPEYGREWVYADAQVDGAGRARIATEFTLVREVVAGRADPALCGPLTDEHRRTFARELRLDEPHMEVTPEMRKAADAICGDETNVVRQARLIFDHVVSKTDHYSVFGASPQGKCLGDAQECMAGTGDCCTDQHALFIALARARGIPCRLFFGSRLQPQNAGKEHDPGYRCWPNFFAPGIGWVPLDISAADKAVSQGQSPDPWFGGLDDRRVEWAEGRSFRLEPAPDNAPDLVIRAWVEVDGKPYRDYARRLTFTTR